MVVDFAPALTSGVSLSLPGLHRNFHGRGEEGKTRVGRSGTSTHTFLHDLVMRSLTSRLHYKETGSDGSRTDGEGGQSYEWKKTTSRGSRRETV